MEDAELPTSPRPFDADSDPSLTYRADQTIETAAGSEARTHGGTAPADPPTPIAVPVEEPYEFHRVLGQGGFGVVWEGVQKSLRRVVAIKTVRTDKLREVSSDSPEEAAYVTRSFRDEAFTSAQLDHPNIVPVYELSRDSAGSPLLAMKLVQGQPWDRLIKKDVGSLSPEEFLAKHIPILLDMAQAVAFAHSRGIVHRDLKPSQVMVGDFGEVLLMDWGLAVAYDEALLSPASVGAAPTREKARNGVGTPAYMAPEQLRPTAAEIGPWTDVWLLGATLYHLLVGQHPRDGVSGGVVWEMASKGEFVDPVKAAAGRHLPEELLALMRECLVVEVAKRTLTAKQFVERLGEYLSGAGKRRESEAITHEVAAKLDSEAADYETLGECIASLGRAHALWPGNARAGLLREKALALFARSALANGDYVLARVQATRLEAGAQRDGIVEDVAWAEARTRAQARTRRIALDAVAALLVVIAGGSIWFNIRLKREVKAKEEARLRADASRQESEGLVAFMLEDLTIRLGPIGQLGVMDSVLRKVDDVLARRNKLEPTVVDLTASANMLLDVAQLRSAQGDLPAAEEAARRALENARAIVALDEKSAASVLNLVVCYSRLGRILDHRGRLDEAEKVIREGIALGEAALAASPGHVDANGSMSESYQGLGHVLKDQGDLPGALAATQKARDLLVAAMTKSPGDLRWPRELSLVVTDIGVILEEQGDFDGALASYREAARLLEQLLVSKPDNMDWRKELSVSLNKIGGILEARGDMEGALAKYLEYQTEMEALVESDPGNSGWQRDLSIGYGATAIMLGGKGDIDGALASNQKAIAIMEKLTAKDPSNAGWQFDLGAGHNKASVLLQRKGDFAASIEESGKSVAIIEKLAAADPANTELKRSIAIARASIGKTHETLKDYPKALAEFEIAVPILESLTEQDPSNVLRRRDLVTVLRFMARTQRLAGAPADARKTALRALGIARELAKEAPTDDATAQVVGMTLAESGTCASLSGDETAARAEWEESVSIMAPLVAKQPGPMEREVVLAATILRLGRLDEARPIVEALLAKGMNDPAFLALCKEKGLEVAVPSEPPKDGGAAAGK